jgi:hypothetical protein
MLGYSTLALNVRELTCDFDSYKKQYHNTPEDCSLFQLYKVYIPCHITNICTYLLLANDHKMKKEKNTFH